MAADSSENGPLELIELERARIGHEIHDTLLPLIFAASASLRGLLEQTALEHDATEASMAHASQPDSHTSQASAARTAVPRDRIAQVADWLDDALQVGRKLLVEVYPPELEGRDWDRVVNETLSRMIDSADAIKWQIDPGVNALPAKVLSAAYRIVIEAVRNAVRHGQATEITITATRDAADRDVADRDDEPSWLITVSDNGGGFNVDDVSPDRFGVRSMVGRARLAGGTCSVESAIGGPTTVRFRWRPPETI